MVQAKDNDGRSGALRERFWRCLAGMQWGRERGNQVCLFGFGLERMEKW